MNRCICQTLSFSCLSGRHLPREFPQINVTVNYVHPKANSKIATDTPVYSLQSLCPEAPNVILLDFNYCNLKKTLGTFYKYVNSPTRFWIFVMVPLKVRIHLWQAPHSDPLTKTRCISCLFIGLCYGERRRGNTPQKYDNNVSLDLQGCFACTDWSVFTESSENINELINVICSFCRDMIIPLKVVHSFPK